jgi:large subunit ribosomal protein L6
MSRVGRRAIEVPGKVKVTLQGSRVRAEGPKGKGELLVPPSLTISLADNKLSLARSDDSRSSRSIHGLTRSLLNNLLNGVMVGYQRLLEINGVGFKAEVRGKEIHFSIGYSHPVIFPLPEGVTADWKELKAGDKQGDLTLKSFDKDLLGRTAAKVRSLRPPEPYKGKGIKYAEEIIRRKVGKTGAA